MTKNVSAPIGATTIFQWEMASGSDWIFVGNTNTIPIPTTLTYGIHDFRFVATVTDGGQTITVIEPAVVDVTLPMVRVPGGVFFRGAIYGSTNNVIEAAGLPTNIAVTVGDFYIGIHQVTQGLFEAVMGFNPSWHHPLNSLASVADQTTPPGHRQDRRPVERVSWFDAIEFANRLSIIAGLTPVYEVNGTRNPDLWGVAPSYDWRAAGQTGSGIPTNTLGFPWNGALAGIIFHTDANGFRLLTEAEWEFAAKGGGDGTAPFSFSGSDNPTHVAWFSPSGLGFTATVSGLGAGPREVGRLMPNGLGIYDMSGNVWEWVYDWRHGSGYNVAGNPAGTFNPTGVNFPGGSALRVSRGGPFTNSNLTAANPNLRVNRRGGNMPHYRLNQTGFRIGRNVNT